jgi:hypothetical protein
MQGNKKASKAIRSYFISGLYLVPAEGGGVVRFKTQIPPCSWACVDKPVCGYNRHGSSGKTVQSARPAQLQAQV